MYIKSITINNIRCFKKLEVAFNCPSDDDFDAFLPNVNLFLGDNGSGKSALLKSIALITQAPIIRNSGFTPYFLARQQKFLKAGSLSMPDDFTSISANINMLRASQKWDFMLAIRRLGDYEEISVPTYINSDDFGIGFNWEESRVIETQSHPAFESFYKDSSPEFFVIGYSASRRAENNTSFNPQGARKIRSLRFQRVAGLFDEHVNLAPLSAWLPRLKDQNGKRQAHFDEAIYLLNKLLPESTTISSDSVDEYNVYFVQNGLKLPFEALSDGYRSYLGWISDLLYHLQSVCPPDQKLVDISGIVMVDEVDLHLHPEWQRRVVPILARTFPKIQWMLTTHSPIVVGTLHHKNIYIMEQSENGTTVRQSEERSYGLNAEQILTSDYFGLTTTRAPGAVNRLKELSDKIQQGDKEAVFEMMEELTRKNLGER